MSEQAVLDNPEVIVDNGFDIPFEDKRGNQEPIKSEPKTTTPKAEEKKVVEPIEDGRNFLKEKLGYDDWDTVKNEIETLKNKSQTQAEEIKFANEISENPYKALLAGDTDKLYSFLDSQKKYSKLTEGEITIANAAQIVKAAMFEKYKDKGLTEQEIEHKFNKQFALPKKPIQAVEELEDEYKERVAEWEELVQDNQRDLMIEAKMSRSEIEKLKSELKFPEIQKTESIAEEPTPQQLADAKVQRELFIKNAENAIKEFDGINVTYKDKDVEISSNYSLSDEEKSAVKNQLMLLADNNYNSNAVFAERWVNDDLTFNYQKMAKDLAVLESYDKSSQKFVGDAVSKATLKLIKDKHQIDIVGAGGGDLQLEDKTAQQKNEDAIWN